MCFLEFFIGNVITYNFADVVAVSRGKIKGFYKNRFKFKVNLAFNT